jgi:hypothetical protein
MNDGKSVNAVWSCATSLIKVFCILVLFERCHPNRFKRMASFNFPAYLAHKNLQGVSKMRGGRQLVLAYVLWLQIHTPLLETS